MAVREANSSGECVYPQSNATQNDIWTELAGLAANQARCTSIFLPTASGTAEGGEDHYQGLARSHKLSDGSVHFFLVHSDVDSGHGTLLSYRYDGPTDGEHVLASSPPTFATLSQVVTLDEQHPSDVAFLPDVNGLDAGYLFVTEEYDLHRVAVYRWNPAAGLVDEGWLFAGFPGGGPQFVFVDRVGDDVFLGTASEHWGWGQLFRAPAERLFGKCAEGSLLVSAFRPAGMFPFAPRGGPCQTKLVRDGNGEWFLLAYRSEDNDDQYGRDYVDVFGVRFDPFVISYRLRKPVHVYLAAGETGFANTGTHHVDASGRLLVSSSYRWDRPRYADDPPYWVCRVDELPSS
jgi:hypothetical protein